MSGLISAGGRLIYDRVTVFSTDASPDRSGYVESRCGRPHVVRVDAEHHMETRLAAVIAS